MFLFLYLQQSGSVSSIRKRRGSLSLGLLSPIDLAQGSLHQGESALLSTFLNGTEVLDVVILLQVEGTIQ
jgi:hypothetical protein